MTILDAITSSPLNVFFTIVIGIGIAYLYYRKPSSSSSSSSAASIPSRNSSYTSSRTVFNHVPTRSSVGISAGGVIDEELQRAIAQIERQERDMIRQEQDAAYQQSLKADKEKKQKREEELKEKQAREKAERDREEQQQRLHQSLAKLKIDIKDKLPAKPVQDEQAVRLLFKLPDGTRVKQDFSRKNKVKHLYWFVFSLDNAPMQFKMTTNFPKRDLPGRQPMPEDFQEDETGTSADPKELNCELTLEDVGLTETQIIFVYDLEA